MKQLFSTLLLFIISYFSFAQKPCEIDANVKDSLGSFKSTKQCIVYERSFAGNSTHLYFSLINSNGVLGIDMQHLKRSNEFMKANCLDKNSKMYLQLNNGKIITLLYSGSDSCGSLVYDDNKKGNRILSGTFVFTKENFEELEFSPVSIMRIKFADETIDYAFKSELVSELDKIKYHPEKYFMDYLKCIKD